MTHLTVHALILVWAAVSCAATLVVPRDFPTIQAAIDAAQPGDVVRVRGGTYEEGLVIDGKTDVTIKGKGRVIITGRSLPLVVQNSTGIVIEKLIFFDNANGIRIDASAAVTIRKCLIDRTRGSLGGIFVNAGSSHRIERNTFREVAAEAIWLWTFVSDSTVRFNKVTGARRNALVVWGENNTAERNTVRLESPTLTTGITISGQGNRAVGNKLVGLTEDGIRVFGSGHHVERNRIIRPARRGLQVASGSTRVERNRVMNPGGDGIRVQGDGNEIRANKVIMPDEDGIALIEIEGNPVTGNLIERNKVIQAGDDGFSVAVSNGGNTFRKNRAKRSGDFGLEDASQTGTNVYEDNKFGSESIS